MTEVPQEQVGRAIAERRRAVDVTQEKLAERVGSTPEWISQVERGVGMPSLALLVAIAEAVNLPVASLFQGAVPKEDRVAVAELIYVLRGLADPALRVVGDTARALAREFGEDGEPSRSTSDAGTKG